MKQLCLFFCIVFFCWGCFFSPLLHADSTGPLWADYIVSPQQGVKKASKHKRSKKMYFTVFHYDGGEVDLDKAEKKRLLKTVYRLDKGTIRSVRFVCAAEKKQTCTQRIKKMKSFILNNIMDDHFRYTVKIIHSENNATKSNSLKVIEK